jgi:hypothetical protein
MNQQKLKGALKQDLDLSGTTPSKVYSDNLKELVDLVAPRIDSPIIRAEPNKATIETASDVYNAKQDMTG